MKSDSGIRVGQVPAGVPMICLCGSTKFKKEFTAAAKELGELGLMVISVTSFTHADGGEISPETKALLDVVHIHKIASSTAIYVINQDGYIGESTMREIAFAASVNRPIFFKEDVPPKVRAMVAKLGGIWNNGLPKFTAE